MTTYSLEAERALLGAILQDPSILLRDAADLSPRWLYRPDHQALLLALRQMQDQGHAIDLVTLPRHLAASGLAGRVGGLEYVLELPDHAPSTAAAGHYVEVIRQTAARRRLIAAMEATSRQAAADGSLDDVGEAMQRAMAEALAIAGGRGLGPVDGGQVIEETLDEMESDQERAEAGELGISSGLRTLDEMVGTRRPGEMTIVAARPAMGKTILAMTALQGALGIAPWMPRDAPAWHVGVVSLEMRRTSLGRRLLSDLADIDYGRIRGGARLSEHEWTAVLDARDRLASVGGSWWVDDQPRLSVGQLIRRVEEQHARSPMHLVIVDYLTLLDLGSDAQRTREVGQAAHDLREMARRLGLHVLLLSQLSRGVERRDDKRPIMSDLRDSGELEQHTDTILMLYRPVVYDDLADPREAYVIARKARHGRVGEVRIRFDGGRQRFSDEEGPLR